MYLPCLIHGIYDFHAQRQFKGPGVIAKAKVERHRIATSMAVLARHDLPGPALNCG
jgi:hypothetical protein